MNSQFENAEITIYHDETKNVQSGNYVGHVLLFVPNKIKINKGTNLFGNDIVEYHPDQLLLDKINQARKENNIQDRKLHFTDISGNKWTTQDEGCLKILHYAVDSLRWKRPEHFDNPLSLKVAVIFYPKKFNKEWYGGIDKKEKTLRYDETVMRMLFKGALHYLYDDVGRVVINNFITDGNPAHRHIDRSRVIERLYDEEFFGRSPLKDNIEISASAKIIPLSSDHKDFEPYSQEYMHANLLQMADLLLGTIIRACYTNIGSPSYSPQIGKFLPDTVSKKNIISHPTKLVLDKRKRGGGFQKSGHYKSFSLSHLSFEKTVPVFQDILTHPIDVFQSCPELDFEV